MRIEVVGADAWAIVFPQVEKLLRELGEEGDDLGELDVAGVESTWRQTPGAVAFLVFADEDQLVGVMTVVESFAIYANGNYGIINEMYVEPRYRSRGVGRRLLDAVAAWGAERGWQRIDVTAPESARWARTRRFYEENGFAFTGPKLKRVIG